MRRGIDTSTTLHTWMTKASGSRSPAVNRVLRGEVQFYPLSTNTQVWSKEMGRRLPTYRYGRDTCNLLQTMMAWQNGYAADCNPAYPCSTQGVISKYGSLVQAEQLGSKPGRCGCKSYMVRQNRRHGVAPLSLHTENSRLYYPCGGL